MNKLILFSSLLACLISCGKKPSSKINVDVTAEKLAVRNGDGKYVVMPIYLPFSDQQVPTYDSPVEKVNFIAGGIGRVVMDLGAGMGAGRVKLTLTQPVPEIPTDVIKEAKIKRLFIYLEPKEGENRWRSWFREKVYGQHDVTFNFLEKMAVVMSTTHLSKIDSWVPSFDDPRPIKKNEYTPLNSLFEEDGEVFEEERDVEEKSIVMLKYHHKNKDRYLRNSRTGKMYIVKTRQPGQTKKFLMKHKQFKNYFLNIHMLNETLVVELKNDPIVEEGFRLVFSENAKEMDKFKIKLIEECRPDTCLDMEVPDMNLLPILTQNNAIRFDAYIDSRKAPESFQLKGFAEFQVKIDSPF